jgi:heavy metal sensor kinase
MSLRLRLTLWYGLLLALSLLAFGSLLYVVLRVNLERQLDEALRLRSAEVGRALTIGPNGLLDSSDLARTPLEPLSVEQMVGPDLFVQVLDQRARLLGTARGQLPIDPETVIDALEGRETLSNLPLGGGRSVRVLTRPLLADGQIEGVVQVGQTLDGLESTLREVRDILALASLAVVALAGVGGFVLGGRALAPIRRVSDTARQIAATGDYGQRLAPRRTRDEVGELVATFNGMIAKVEASLEEQRRFLADTSHELRSPLTVIRANLGFLWRETDPETRAECLHEAEDEAARMSRLVNDLLLLGQVEAGELLQRAPVAVDQLLSEVAEQVRVQSDQRRVELLPAEPTVILADRDRLKQLLWNLVENAVRYTPAGGLIRLGMARDADWIELSVSDNGPGIAPEHLNRLFDRFYRVDRARSRATGGAGLGLAIVKHIAQAHGGSVSVESAVGQGSTFRVRLPATTPEAHQVASSQPRSTASATAALGGTAR